MSVSILDADGEQQQHPEAEAIRLLDGGALLVMADLQDGDASVARPVALYPAGGWWRASLEPPSDTVIYPAGSSDEELDLGAAGGSEPLASQVARLAQFIADAIPGEPSRSEGAIDTAIRLLDRLTIPTTIGAAPEEPRNPQESPAAGRSPYDSVTLLYGELRQLIALHLDQARLTMGRRAPWTDVERLAGAVRDGEAPLRLGEILGLPYPAQEPELPETLPQDADPRGPLVLHDPAGWRRWRERAENLLDRGLAAGPRADQVRVIAELCGYAYQVGRQEAPKSSNAHAVTSHAIIGEVQQVPQRTLRVGDTVAVEDEEGKGVSGVVESWHVPGAQDVVVIYARIS